MEMDDHHHHHHHQYAISDLRHLMNGRPSTHFSTSVIQQPASTAEMYRNLAQVPAQQHHQYEMMMVGGGGGGGRQVGDFMARGLHEFCADTATTSAAAAASVSAAAAATVGINAATPSFSGLDADGGSFGGDIGGTGRWPRQETLTLLEIRSRLDPKFKEANQKGPLWDEVSRIMSEEHGYQRSGKKCREKFENLYKYYKKTKEGKAGRQDGKHYRFFRQLEALYGESSNSVSVPETHYLGTSLRYQGATNTNPHATQDPFLHSQKLCDSLSLSNNTSEFDTSSSDGAGGLMDNDSTEKRRKRRGGRSWKTKIKEFIDLQMRKLMERQEVWLDKLTKTLEQKEQEKILREEEWRRQEAERIDREHKFWAKERARLEARDAAMIEALQNLTGKQFSKTPSPEELMGTDQIQNSNENQNENGSHETINTTTTTGNADSWPESEIAKLIELKASMDSRFEQSGCSEEILWEEISAKMACLGYERSPLMCKDKWDTINNYLTLKTKEYNKKRKENSRTSDGGCGYFPSCESLYNQPNAFCEINEQGPETIRLQTTDGSSPGSNSNAAGNSVGDSCFRFLMADGENLWENYGLKLSKGDENQ